ncbi:hypothetical protein EDD37DRAFT_322024 [Exophiala viscosa]|uniref:Uncharacterized protein n=1 Tax=Exophiala viscosa TaxID=2486360 RepID=A0AAN6DWQ5_9EURO|nr:hypothetical protein EDD36DRAFT_419016 [Exophiala viscosa]KAI1625929.1 hypothetical protein EDD37DRAFT_322024 [Exophiala viscosa]
MCKAHVLRFCCGHGVLMGFDVCRLAPCPILKTTGVKLPQQPYKCYNCQNRLSNLSSTMSSSRAGCDSSMSSRDSASSQGSSASPPRSPIARTKTSAPLPGGIARQPTECSMLSRRSTWNDSLPAKAFAFSCCSSSHFVTPHYMILPNHLPHQDHSCPPCQLEELRMRADREATASAKAEYPHLTGEMLVSDGRVWEDWQTKPTLEGYIDEKRSDERQMWLHVTRKWTQDLKKLRVLVAEEDGLGLLG